MKKKYDESFEIIEFGEEDRKEYEKTKKLYDLITEDVYNPDIFYVFLLPSSSKFLL